MIYLISYFLLNLHFFLFSHSRKSTNWLFPFVLMGLILLFRYQVGWDWEHYDYFFNNLPNNEFHWEAGFYYFSSFLEFSNLNQYLVIGIISYLSVVYLAFKVLGKGIVYFFIPFTFFGYIDMFSVLRQELALTCFIFSIIFFLNKKYIYGFLCLIFAPMFHVSGLILPLFLLFFYYGYRYVLILILLSMFFVQFHFLSLFVDGVLSLPFLNDSELSKIQSYFETATVNFKLGFSLRYIELLILSILPLLYPYVRKVIESSKSYKLVYMAVVLNMFLYGILNDVSIMWERFAVYLWPFEAILIAIILKHHHNSVTKFIFMSTVVFAISIHHYQYWSSPGRGAESNFDRFYPYNSLLGGGNVSEK